MLKPLLSRNGKCEAGRHEALPHLFVAPEANPASEPLGCIWLRITSWPDLLPLGQAKLPLMVWSASFINMLCYCYWLEYLLDYCWTIFYQSFTPGLFVLGALG